MLTNAVDRSEYDVNRAGSGDELLNVGSVMLLSLSVYILT